MKIGVGTMSKRKNEVVAKVLAEVTKERNITLMPYAAKSKVPETPWDHQTKDGAYNRAYDTQEFVIADFYIGLESGLVERYGNVYEEAWACVMTPKKESYFGYSSGLRLPDFIVEKMKKHNKQHWEIMNLLDKEAGIEGNDDTWGTYSSNMIVRDISLEEALRNALVQLYAPVESLYRK